LQRSKINLSDLAVLYSHCKTQIPKRTITHDCTDSLVRTYSNKDDDGAWISVEAERRMEHVTGVTQLATKTAERVTEKVCGLNH
jgi:hypothetical protein